MAAHLLEPVHKAEDQLKIGLANLDRQAGQSRHITN
jgi:hypothetical protein